MPICKRCPAEIIFAKQKGNPNAISHPLNARPDPKGNLLVARNDRGLLEYEVLTKDDLARAQAQGIALYISHFATCPNRQEFRRAS
jgi:hypothetical protein